MVIKCSQVESINKDLVLLPKYENFDMYTRVYIGSIRIFLTGICNVYRRIYSAWFKK